MTEQIAPVTPEIQSHVVHPARALHRKYVEPILFLAERMASVDNQIAAAERRTVDELAAKAHMPDFRTKVWFREMKDSDACAKLDIDVAKMGALVVLTLVLKSDSKKKAQEFSYFTRIRTRLGAQPIAVPADYHEHMKLALQYLAAP